MPPLKPFLWISITVLGISGLHIHAQHSTDTARLLNQITVSAYHAPQTLHESPSSVSVLPVHSMLRYHLTEPLHLFNTAPGVRMEERSPGSYRLSIRGSLLRSPFGVRNIKVYIDEFPFTDAGGNTYINLIDPANLKQIEILKGPDGSMFGANSGGVVLLRTYGDDTIPQIGGTIAGGMYGRLRQQVHWKESWAQTSLRIFESYQRFDGYRTNSAMERFTVQLNAGWKYLRQVASRNKIKTHRGELKFFGLYTDLKYQTPGGLNAAQFEADPSQARPATAFLPGAVEQKAGVFNRTGFLGLSSSTRFGKSFRYVIALSFQYTGFRNPFITNYETRNEITYGGRTYLESQFRTSTQFEFTGFAGAEWQNMHSHIRNFDNNAGEPGNIQKQDKIFNTQYFFFAKTRFRMFNRIIFEAGLSVNNAVFKVENDSANKTFKPELMPRFALSVIAAKPLSFRATVSRGFSPPTLAEIRPSDNAFYPQLEAESGWNYEGGFRLNFGQRFWIDACAFHFSLDQAIVRRVHDDGSEYFVNSGKTRQTGVETQLEFWPMKMRNKGYIRGIRLQNSTTLNFFFFDKYMVDTTDYSGNRVTGVPAQVIVSALSLHFALGIYFFSEYTFTSSIPLNDANSEFASEFHLMRLRLGWRHLLKKGILTDVYAGGDNVLNQAYSLGNDLNAFGGRYYNAAPLLNVYGGITLSF